MWYTSPTSQSSQTRWTIQTLRRQSDTQSPIAPQHDDRVTNSAPTPYTKYCYVHRQLVGTYRVLPFLFRRPYPSYHPSVSGSEHLKQIPKVSHTLAPCPLSHAIDQSIFLTQDCVGIRDRGCLILCSSHGDRTGFWQTPRTGVGVRFHLYLYKQTGLGLDLTLLKAVPQCGRFHPYSTMCH